MFDCNILAQALINLRGPAALCIELAQRSAVLLFASPIILAEVRELQAAVIFAN